MSLKKFSKNKEKAAKKHPFAFWVFPKGFRRLFRYLIVRIFTVVLAVGVGVYLTLIVLNLGGYVDTIQKAQIMEIIGGRAFAGEFDDIPEDEYLDYIEELQWNMEEARGLHEPLPIRTARWWFKGITLQWGEAERLKNTEPQSRQVKDVILDRVPYTLLLVGGANFGLFFSNLWIAMRLSRNHGKFWDRLLSSLTPISSIPSWIHGVILLTLFALQLRILPFKGMFDGAPPEDTLHYALQILQHMVLPVTAVILSVFFQGVYAWRTYFLVHAGEDYVELAQAKGLPDRMIHRRYILRPTLPSIITSFSMMVISFWEGAIALEILFNWTGLGALFMSAIRMVDRPVVVGIVVMFAYLMGLSVIFLDIIYALVDPRVRMEKNGGSVKKKAYRKNGLKRFLNNLFSCRKRKTFKKSRMIEITEHNDTPAHKDDSPRLDKVEGYSRTLLKTVGENLSKYPLAAAGLLIILVLFLISIGTVFAMPYDQAVAYWHGEHWMETPRLARPVWFNFFRRDKLPESIFFDSSQKTQDGLMKQVLLGESENMKEDQLSFDFEFTADAFPQDLVIYFFTNFEEKAPFSVITMLTPDGRELELKSLRVIDKSDYSLSAVESSSMGVHKPREITAVQEVFGDPSEDLSKPLKGTYQLIIHTYLFEAESDFDVRGVLHGQVFGLFGTDNQRRDLTVAMLWGTPVVLAFGIMGVLVTAITILLAAIGAYYGGILDEILQRITEINITIPTIMVAVMVYILYSQSIWVIMAVVILMNVFGNALKEYRAMFIQLKESPYIEAAKTYGSSNLRIIFRYMFPRIIPVMIPQLVISIPGFVFLEATLAYLGVVPPYLPTWGKVILQALNEGTFQGHYFWVLEPIAMAMITGLAFAFVGFALDQILNPRLRSK